MAGTQFRSLDNPVHGFSLKCSLCERHASFSNGRYILLGSTGCGKKMFALQWEMMRCLWCLLPYQIDSMGAIL